MLEVTGYLMFGLFFLGQVGSLTPCCHIKLLVIDDYLKGIL